jgi:hydroxyacylglutathione hydrolase
MQQEIKTITLSLPYKLGSVNCYLVKIDGGYVLIDTGSSNRRSELESALESAGCKPGNLKLIVITHGDFDHVGNTACLREKFASRSLCTKTMPGWPNVGICSGTENRVIP